MVTPADVTAAAERIRGHVHRTPVLTSSTIDGELGARVFFKCENMQKVGAFKARGACNAVMALSDAEASRGVIAHSSGNHAAALAYAAARRGIPCVVVMPDSAPEVKVAAVRGYGAEIVFCAAADRDRGCAQQQQQRGAGTRVNAIGQLQLPTSTDNVQVVPPTCINCQAAWTHT